MKQMIIIALISSIAFAATAQSTKLQYGLKAGMNVAALSGKNSGEAYNLNAWYAGAQLTLPLSKVFAFQPELLYSREGFRGTGMKYNFDFARMPLTFQLRHESGVYAEFGAQFGVKLRSTANDIDDDQKIEIPDMESYNAGLIMGMGYRHTSGIGINIRFAPSLTGVGKGLDAKLTTLSFGISYSLESNK
ncbi:MAG: PorT family protein [Chitinophagaceae bacterium]|nr:PorT family protein [Chitinophagaceae bacterium]